MSFMCVIQKLTSPKADNTECESSHHADNLHSSNKIIWKEMDCDSESTNSVLLSSDKQENTCVVQRMSFTFSPTTPLSRKMIIKRLILYSTKVVY
jgi:hypothetical protein